MELCRGVKHDVMIFGSLKRKMEGGIFVKTR
jgi:hypothetical protein